MAYKTFQNGYPLAASELNNYLMNQSVIVFADATARTAAIATPTEGMITYLEDTNTVEVYNGTTWTDINDNTAAIPKSTVTTAGDLIVADGNASVTRLGIGTDDQVLTMVSGAPAWADAAGGGGATLLSSTTLSGSQTIITDIDQSYKTLIAKLINPTFSSASYIRSYWRDSSGAFIDSGVNGITNGSISGGYSPFYPASNWLSGKATFVATVSNYAQSGVLKPAQFWGSGIDSSGNNQTFNYAGGTTDSTANPISQVRIYTGSTFTGGTVEIWGSN